MPSSNRPYFRSSLKELIKLIERSRNNQSILDAVIVELSYRKTKQAIALRKKLISNKQESSGLNSPRERADNDPRVIRQQKQMDDVVSQQQNKTMVKTCDICGKPMRLRLARRGANAGNYFYGCSGYPNCEGTQDVDQDELSSEEKQSVANRNSTAPAKPANEVIKQLGMRELPRSFLRDEQPRAIKVKAHHPASELTVFDSRGALYGDLTSIPNRAQPIRNWGIEHRRPSSSLLSEKSKLLLALYEKHLQRGRSILLDPEVEKFILQNQKFLNDSFANINFDTFNSNGEIFDSEQEKSFWQAIEKRSKNISASLNPQVYLESLIPDQANTNQRVDFFCQTEEGPVVIEIDGAQHLESNHINLDQQRDRMLEEAGFRTIRISTENVGTVEEKITLNNEYLRTTPEQIAHVISVTLSAALRTGALNLNSENWDISIQLKEIDTSLDGFFKEALSGAIRHLANVNNLINNRDNFPLSVCLSIGSNKFDIIGRQKADVETSDRIFLHFDRIPDQELSIDHFYYRELATSYPVKINATDANSIIVEPDRESCRYFLNYFFRFDDFREGQWEGISRTLSGKDSLILMPTGHGKSIIFQLASLLRPGTALVIDPIISLIEDQLDNLSNFGITRAVGISKDIDEGTKKKIIDNFSLGQYSLVFVAPERLQMQDFRNSLRALTTFSPVSLVAIDEAHCVSEWGHSFRTAYLNLGRNCREYCKSKSLIPPLLALTGTASRSVLKDVKRELGILDYDATITPETFNRTELKFQLETCKSEEKFLKLKGILNSIPSKFGMNRDSFFSASGNETNSGLIFCPNIGTQYGVVDIARRVNEELNIPASFYSGGIPRGIEAKNWQDIKKGAAHDFKRNNTPLMAATSAFGMGIDKPNIRYCIHYNIPASIESFYQEAGRAGRDRRDALCFIIASNDDPQRTTQLLSDTVNINAVDQAVKKIKFKGDDVIRNLYFHTSSFKGVKEELGTINQVLDLIDASPEREEISIIAKELMNQYEKAIHRLVIVGYVEDYTIDYKSRSIKIELSNPDPERIRTKLLQYAENYQRSRAKAIESSLPKDAEFSRSFLVRILTILLEFVYNTVELGRRRALLEMCQLTRDGATDESIRSNILAYLEKSEFDDQLDAIVDDIQNQALVSLILEDVVSAKQAISLKGRVIKLLEDYPDHPSLLLLRATVECMLENKDEDIVVQSLENWANSATTNYSLPLDTLADSYNHAMSIISKSMPVAAAKATKTIMYGSNDPAFIRHVLQNSETLVEQIYAFTALLKLAANEFEPVKKIIKEKAR